LRQSEARERDGRRGWGKSRVWRVWHWTVAISRAHAAAGWIICARRRRRIIRRATNAIRTRDAILITDANAAVDAAIRDGRDGRGVLLGGDGRARSIARARAVIGFSFS
jgi:hypothetical protein